MDQKFRSSQILSWLIIFLATIASGAGLFTDVYQDNTLVTAAWKGNDLVTTVLVVPIFVLALVFYKNCKNLFQLVWAGALGYMFYNYVFYLFGAALNHLFLIYVALVAMSAYALVFLLARMDVISISEKILNIPGKWISGYMLFFAVPWSTLEISRALSYVFTGVVPMDVVQTGHPTAMVYAVDLTIVMPGFVLAAIWLLMKKPWGNVLAAIFLFKGITYGLALISMVFFVYRATGKWDPLVPFYGFLATGSLVSYFFLIRNFFVKKLEISD